jgi:hypothetical protein
MPMNYKVFWSVNDLFVSWHTVATECYIIDISLLWPFTGTTLNLTANVSLVYTNLF